MSDAIVSTVIGVVGTGLIGVFYMQLQNLRDDLKQGFRDQGDSIKSLEAAVVQLNGTAEDHGKRLSGIEETAKVHGERLARIEATAIGQGERLARIETKLDIDPPTEAA
ncbi:MAG: hypothetical protein F4124_02605 [Acidimicrobiia bacterium]|nr:hypothetical protein [Acidimicrobiia bacterium]MYB74247.1 hypothetical protein [Acidimicrobiia bacterium]MYH98309.1 hypothetical protein [Acidimicrobiia bacterium]